MQCGRGAPGGLLVYAAGAALPAPWDKSSGAVSSKNPIFHLHRLVLAAPDSKDIMKQLQNDETYM